MTKGIEVVRAEGIVEGIEKEKLVIARQMKVDGLPYDTISKYTGTFSKYYKISQLIHT